MSNHFSVVIESVKKLLIQKNVYRLFEKFTDFQKFLFIVD